jgi:hypothetical protein
MIKMPGRRVARPGEPTKSEGPDAPELTPEEIQAKINANRALFIKYANELQDQAIKALDIVRRRTPTACSTSARRSTRRARAVISSTGTRTTRRLGSSTRPTRS